MGGRDARAPGHAMRALSRREDELLERVGIAPVWSS
jgi:hypothetical protein